MRYTEWVNRGYQSRCSSNNLRYGSADCIVPFLLGSEPLCRVFVLCLNRLSQALKVFGFIQIVCHSPFRLMPLQMPLQIPALPFSLARRRPFGHSLSL